MSTETYHEMYRRTTLGNTLQESLDEMLDHNLINHTSAMKIMQKFDQCICTALSKRVKNRLVLKGRLNTYRNCDNVWTFVMNNVEIRDSSILINVEKMKIVACECKDSKSAKTPQVIKVAGATSAGFGNAVSSGVVLDSDGLGTGGGKMAPIDEDRAFTSDGDV